MKITKVIDIITRDDQESFTLDDLVGTPAPFAYQINYTAQGYGKFKIDPKTVNVLAKNLYKIEDPMSRKQIYRILHDMLKTSDICGVQLLDICTANMAHETAVDVISTCLQRIIPVVIKSYLPTSVFAEKKGDMFEMILGILASGNIKDKATEGLVLNSLFGSAVLEKHLDLLVNWFNNNTVTDL